MVMPGDFRRWTKFLHFYVRSLRRPINVPGHPQAARMQSFRVYRRRPRPLPIFPGREAKDYSPAAAREMEQIFAYLLWKDRRRGCWVGVACAVAALSAALLLRHHLWTALVASTWIVFMGLAGFPRTFFPPLHCPGCGKNPEGGPEHYCPECGSHDSLAFYPYQGGCCRRCGGDIKRRRNGKTRRRFYKIRYCWKCGLLLDRHGI